MNTSKITIYSLILLIVISFAMLSFLEQRQENYDYQKNWWVLYFSNPKDSSLQFTIENHSNKNNFHWEILKNNEKAQEGDVEIKKGAAWTSDVQLNDAAGKIIVKVSDKESKKEIYKIIGDK